MKTIVLTEEQVRTILEDKTINSSEIKKDIIDSNDLEKKVNAIIGDYIDDKKFEKRIKEISAEVVHNLFKILWQRDVFYSDIKQ